MDLAKRRIWPKSCALVCKRCAENLTCPVGHFKAPFWVNIKAKKQKIKLGNALNTGRVRIRDLPSLVKKLCFDKESAFSSRALRHFLEVNGHDAAKSHVFQDAGM